METYKIYEGYMSDLEKKLNRIHKKCEKYGCDFHYDIVGESYEKVERKDGSKVTVKFIEVEVEGTAIINDWEFVASVEHTTGGNIIRCAMADVEVPKKYWTSDMYCEHCNTNHKRKYCYIVRNTKTNEFRQVGKTCLKDYTGISAEIATAYLSLRELFEEVHEHYEDDVYDSNKNYFKIDEVLAYGAEIINHFGYISKRKVAEAAEEDIVLIPTITKVNQYIMADYNLIGGSERVAIKDEMDEIGFNKDSDKVITEVENALNWLKEQEATDGYMNNLKVICNMEYIEWKHMGILISLLPTYHKTVDDNIKSEKAKAKSEHIGNIGDKINIDCESFELLYVSENWVNSYRCVLTHVYKITDKSGNVYIWRASRGIDEIEKIIKVTGTVKDHNNYNGIKQTQVTRCKVAYT